MTRLGIGQAVQFGLDVGRLRVAEFGEQFVRPLPRVLGPGQVAVFAVQSPRWTRVCGSWKAAPSLRNKVTAWSWHSAARSTSPSWPWMSPRLSQVWAWAS